MIKKTKNSLKRQSRSKIKAKKSIHTKYLYYSAFILLSVIAVSYAAIAILHINILGSFDAAHSQTTNTSSAYHNTNTSKTLSSNTINQTILAAQVVPKTGYVLSFKWGDNVHKLVEAGALNPSNLSILLNNSKEPLTPVEKKILNGTYNGYIQFNSTNVEFVQLVLWSLGVNNNNTIVNNGPIINASIPYANSINNNVTLKQKLNQNVTPQWVASRYFASTGGYGPIGKLQLGMLNIMSLSPSEQIIADYTAENSYRPCCNNPTAFPDCNHGAAALGLIELLASQGANQSQIFSAVKYFNQYQFPQQYSEIAAYFDSQGKNYSQVNSSEVIGYSFSSYSGYSTAHQYLIKNGILAQPTGSNASCGA